MSAFSSLLFEQLVGRSHRLLRGVGLAGKVRSGTAPPPTSTPKEIKGSRTICRLCTSFGQWSGTRLRGSARSAARSLAAVTCRSGVGWVVHTEEGKSGAAEAVADGTKNAFKSQPSVPKRHPNPSRSSARLATSSAPPQASQCLGVQPQPGRFRCKQPVFRYKDPRSFGRTLHGT